MNAGSAVQGFGISRMTAGPWQQWDGFTLSVGGTRLSGMGINGMGINGMGINGMGINGMGIPWDGDSMG